MGCPRSADFDAHAKPEEIENKRKGENQKAQKKTKKHLTKQ